MVHAAGDKLELIQQFLYGAVEQLGSSLVQLANLLLDYEVLQEERGSKLDLELVQAAFLLPQWAVGH